MPEEKPSDNVEKVLTDQKAVEERKQALIADLLKQKAEAVKAFDDQLAKLGYAANSGKPKRSHHKPASGAGKTAAKAKPATPGGEGGAGKVNTPTVPRRRR